MLRLKIFYYADLVLDSCTRLLSAINCCNVWHSIILMFCQDQHPPYLLAHYQRLLGRTARWHEVVNGQLSSKLEWRRLQQTTCLDFIGKWIKNCARDHCCTWHCLLCCVRSFILFYCCSESKTSIIRLNFPWFEVADKYTQRMTDLSLQNPCVYEVRKKTTIDVKIKSQIRSLKAPVADGYNLTVTSVATRITYSCRRVTWSSLTKKPICKHMSDISWPSSTCKFLYCQ